MPNNIFQLTFVKTCQQPLMLHYLLHMPWWMKVFVQYAMRVTGLSPFYLMSHWIVKTQSHGVVNYKTAQVMCVAIASTVTCEYQTGCCIKIGQLHSFQDG